MEIQFLGAAGTVTGSKYLLRVGDRKILVDCGLFQGYKQLRLRNRAVLPIRPEEIDAVVLTHAHLDHSGYLPVLVRDGFAGPVFSTSATRDLCRILLTDSGRLQEEEADYANRHGFSKHKPALPLYTEEDALRSLRSFETVAFASDIDLGGGVRLRLAPAGHMLGAASVRIEHAGRSILFSGDVGRSNDPILYPPAPLESADYLVVESTYGNRLHEKVDPLAVLEDVFKRTFERGGLVIIPSFAVGRAQTLMYMVHALKQAGRMPSHVPVYLNSPMAIEATRLYLKHHEYHRLDAQQCEEICASVHAVATPEESRRLNEKTRGPAVIIAGSGMATGGRVLHHIKAFGPDRRNTILFAGFQAGGTRGADMVAGAESVKIHGDYIPIHAEVKNIDSLSGHADYEEMLTWLGTMKGRPRHVFVTHGEASAADAMRHRIEEKLGWAAEVPEHQQRSRLD
ncbi:MAG TPA: MBL fold metallo-hydrolase [Rhodocyclaceae bacterium]|nr:MBL fold metallo-hydrolase [Rhodocyclaceae bacterium]